ncbi:3-phosphoshikimate 1-carboxyvinyltransferase [Enterococcus faecium]|nr:3-phosphoshikimate 1-carboxyvinyltransferase [Enterococcus faecium]
MQLLQQIQGLRGTVRIPADKSISHRSIMFGAIAEGTTTIQNFLRAEDCLSTLHAFQQLGVEIEEEEEVIKIHGRGSHSFVQPTESIDMGNSGTTIRLLMGILAGQPFTTTLFGDASLSKRPMGRVMEPLREMGADLQGEENDQYLPITVTGTRSLSPIRYNMPVASAQVKSALLFAALQAEGTSVIVEKERSRNHTEEMIRQFGGRITVEDKTIIVTGPQKLTGQQITVPGDISSAAFFLAAGLLVPESQLLLKNVGVNPTRTGILDVLEEMGAAITQTNHNEQNQSADLSVKTSHLKKATIGGEIIPRLIDELPILALVATQAEGITIIKDAEELKVKETNRIDAVAEELQKMGAKIKATADGLIIHGPTPLHGAKVSSRGDHRIGMMLQVAALIADGPCELEGAEAVSISYPAFFDDLAELVSGGEAHG